jgi:pectate lyase
VSGDAGNYSVVVTNAVSSVTSTSVSLTVNAAPVGPTITTQPAAQSVTVSQSASFTVTATGSGTLSFQWTKNGSAISGATSTTYTIASASSSDAGNYAVVVTNAVSSTTSSSAALVVTIGSVVANPDGSAATTTGGSAGQTVTASTAADLRTYAQSTTPYVINVSGVINLGGSVLVKSNKTIQGFDANATIVGCLDLSSGGVNNVIIRGLNITNPGTIITNGAYADGGSGIIIRNASNVYISHLSLFDCANNLIEISTGSDNITVSWSEFYYTAAQTVHRSAMITGLSGTETKPLHITLHHNWWSDSCSVNLPSGTYGYVHMFNNYFKASGDTSASDASDYAQFFAERNVYEQINDPLYKENLITNAPVGRIRSIGNLFTSCTGKAADAGTDAVFTPLYSYELLVAADVATVTTQLSGNTAGASSATPTGSTASITGPTDVVTPSSSFTLTAAPTGFTGTSYQWRLNNFDISGATSATYAVNSAQSANAGIYTVVIGLAAGDSVVSSALTITLGTSSGSPGGGSSSSSGGSPASSASGGGGGGAPSVWYLALIGALALARARKNFFA